MRQELKWTIKVNKHRLRKTCHPLTRTLTPRNQRRTRKYLFRLEDMKSLRRALKKIRAHHRKSRYALLLPATSIKSLRSSLRTPSRSTSLTMKSQRQQTTKQTIDFLKKTNLKPQTLSHQTRRVSSNELPLPKSMEASMPATTKDLLVRSLMTLWTT